MPADMVADAMGARRVITWRRVHTPFGARVCAGVLVWECVCAHVCTWVISGLSILFKICAYPLNTLIIYLSIDLHFFHVRLYVVTLCIL